MITGGWERERERERALHKHTHHHHDNRQKEIGWERAPPRKTDKHTPYSADRKN